MRANKTFIASLHKFEKKNTEHMEGVFIKSVSCSSSSTPSSFSNSASTSTTTASAMWKVPTKRLSHHGRIQNQHHQHSILISDENYGRKFSATIRSYRYLLIFLLVFNSQHIQKNHIQARTLTHLHTHTLIESNLRVWTGTVIGGNKAKSSYKSPTV